MARYSEEQWKEFKFKLTLFIVILVVGLAIAALGPGLERLFLVKALAKKTEPWAAKHVLNVALVEEHTFRRKRAQEIYENEFYLNWRGDEQQLAGLKTMMEVVYPDGEPTDHQYFLFWKIAEFPRGEDGMRQAPAWVGGEGAKPHALFPKAMLHLARCYEDARNYTYMRHLHKALRHCFESGDFTQAQEKADLEEAIRRDAARQYEHRPTFPVSRT